MAEIIATVLAETASAARRAARQAAMAGADWVELRLDTLPAQVDLPGLIASIGLPVIVTCRTPRDGGAYRGTLAARREVLQRALAAGALGIDLEDWEEWRPAPRPRLTIRSYHNLVDAGDELAARRDGLLAMGADVAKIAVTAPDLADAAPVLQLLATTEQVRAPTVAFAMGRAAAASRVLSCALGAPFAYGTPGVASPVGEGAADAAAALGQLPVDQMRGLYGVHRLSSSTLLFGLLGNPANHSLGPWLHNRTFRHLDLDAIYVPLETARPAARLVGDRPVQGVDRARLPSARRRGPRHRCGQHRPVRCARPSARLQH
jgi:3-dehydroquinate dehydratase/shikimate dehydrogenase